MTDYSAPASGSTAGPSLSQPLHGASFGQAVARLFKKYARFKGYASRSEYWWAVLFHFVIITVISIPYYQYYFAMIEAGTFEAPGPLVILSMVALFIWSLATVVPMLAVAWRRLHDAGFPGPIYFILLVPFVGPIALIVLLVLPTKPERHRNEWADTRGD